MQSKGTIYQFGKSGYFGETKLELPWYLRLAYAFTRGVGAGLVGFAIISLIFTFSPIIQEEINYLVRNNNDYEYHHSIDSVEADGILAVQKEADFWKVNSYFSIVIPKTSAASSIIANTDTDNDQEFSNALQKGIVHQKGSFFPGQDENIVLYAHSPELPVHFARYNAGYYLLRKLEKGDEIIIFFADKKYSYEIIGKKIIEGSEEWMGDGEGEKLFLLTCDPLGTTLRQLVVVAQPDY